MVGFCFMMRLLFKFYGSIGWGVFRVGGNGYIWFVRVVGF